MRVGGAVVGIPIFKYFDLGQNFRSIINLSNEQIAKFDALMEYRYQILPDKRILDEERLSIEQLAQMIKEHTINSEMKLSIHLLKNLTKTLEGIATKNDDESE